MVLYILHADVLKVCITYNYKLQMDNQQFELVIEAT